MLDPKADDATARRTYRGIAMIDVMHYFPPEQQARLAREAFRLLEAGGTLIVREVDPDGGMVSAWNRLYEKIATGIGFTRAEKQGLHFRSRRGWEEMLEEAGFEVRSERCSSFLFADILYICQRTPT
jgi:O-methyltransferase involved in polyketide biosynthesis